MPYFFMSIRDNYKEEKEMINPQYRKTQLRDNEGVILLPQTTASMVSEEPDRRFVDNVEKTVLNTLTEEAPILKELAGLVGQIRLMADNIDSLVSILDGSATLQEIGSNGDLLISLIPLVPQIQNLIEGTLKTRSLTSSILYSIVVDDETDPNNPTLKLVKVDEEPTPDIKQSEEPLLDPVEGEPNYTDPNIN